MPTIELNKKPLVQIVIGPDCPVCKEVYYITEEKADPGEGMEEPMCITCALARVQADFILLFGWKIFRTPRQIVAQPLKLMR